MKPTFNKKIKQNKQKKTKIQKSNVTSPISYNQNSQIINGYFLNEMSYKELIIQRVNNFLYGVLAFLVLLCFVGYYFVSCKEVQLNQISRETLELNYENDELQNKLDTLQSYYNIDEAVSKTNILERAKNVVEIDAVDLPKLNLNKKNRNGHSLVVSY